MAAKNIDVYVYEDGDELKVYPPVVKADGSGPDQLIFHNSTGEDLVFCFGTKSLQKTVPTFVGVDKGKTSNGDAVQSMGGGKSELFPFQVVAYKKGKKAKGNSDPILIIEN